MSSEREFSVYDILCYETTHPDPVNSYDANRNKKNLSQTLVTIYKITRFNDT